MAFVLPKRFLSLPAFTVSQNVYNLEPLLIIKHREFPVIWNSRPPRQQEYFVIYCNYIQTD